ncbi:MAG: cobalt ECF transporter T component CbiQ [Thermodesulfobacteriota bacterium]|nr:cobalt ECF transporter T component CbiQ [Thermodesulfobacteriota bacterium]
MWDETRESVLVHLDPRVKILSVTGLSIVTAVITDMPAVCLAFCFALCLVLVARIPLAGLIKSLSGPNLFIAMMWVFLPFTIPGTPIFQVFSFEATRQGIIFAFIITLRCNAVILFMMALMASTSPSSMVHAMNRLHVPDKVVYLFFFTYRYAFEIIKEYKRIHTAMRVRSFRPKTNLHTYRSYAYLMGMLLVGSYERGQRIHSAMICRGFNGTFVHLDNLDFCTGDFVAAAIILLTLAGLVVI